MRMHNGTRRRCDPNETHCEGEDNDSLVIANHTQLTCWARNKFLIPHPRIGPNRTLVGRSKGSALSNLSTLLDNRACKFIGIFKKISRKSLVLAQRKFNSSVERTHFGHEKDP